MKTVALVNPPARGVVIRDYFCSKTSQAAYINPPVDFVCLSGRLAKRFDVRLVDAVAERLSTAACRARIQKLNPEAVIGLTGFVSWDQDAPFFESLDLPVILLGDILLENPAQRLADNPWADAFALDFTVDDPVRYLLGARDSLPSMAYRRDDTIIAPDPARSSVHTFEIPVPRHELFLPLDYRYPFVLGKPFASVLTEYGCPFNCGFCIMGQLGHKSRPVSNVVPELEALRKRGVRDIFFMDQTFGSDTNRTREILDALSQFKPRFRWLCFSRVDRADEGLLPDMKRAGCHTVIYGIESADDALLKTYRKGTTQAQIRATFAAARRCGIRTVGTLLFGLPEDTVASCERTIEFVKAIPCDFISVNIAVPRMGTPMRADAVRRGIVPAGLDRMDQSGAFISMQAGDFTTDELLRLKRKALREFYLNAPYAARRLRGIRSLDQFRIETRQGISLLRNFLKGG
jgi:radical SAM superfamily enzyme YgiQ (UPF0313 family)